LYQEKKGNGFFHTMMLSVFIELCTEAKFFSGSSINHLIHMWGKVTAHRLRQNNCAFHKNVMLLSWRNA